MFQYMPSVWSAYVRPQEIDASGCHLFTWAQRVD
jgi:hypothetical protein